jgi:hypothetical protein
MFECIYVHIYYHLELSQIAVRIIHTKIYCCLLPLNLFWKSRTARVVTIYTTYTYICSLVDFERNGICIWKQGAGHSKTLVIAPVFCDVPFFLFHAHYTCFPGMFPCMNWRLHIRKMPPCESSRRIWKECPYGSYWQCLR